MTWPEPKLSGEPYRFFIALPVTVGAITYGGYQVYVHHGIAVWGTEVQGRYFLPVNFYIFGIYVIHALSPYLLNARGDQDVQSLRGNLGEPAAGQIFIVMALIAFVAGVVFVSSSSAIEGLELRYFLNDEVYKSYLELAG